MRSRATRCLAGSSLGPASNFADEVRIPAEALPGLRTGEDGMVHGGDYHLKLPDALHQLAGWLEVWNNELRDGSPAAIRILEGENSGDLANVLRSMPREAHTAADE